MIHQIYSDVDPEILIATVITNFGEAGRHDASTVDEILQLSALSLAKGKVVKSHMHKPIVRDTIGTQEAWIVISGSIRAEIFDTNQDKISENILMSGDCVVLYRGGHSMQVLEDDTVIYEIKNGPYFGATNDSQPIT
jgi:mannose-6-phosphate isomerase-like protein (cupin superfamily)